MDIYYCNHLSLPVDIYTRSIGSLIMSTNPGASGAVSGIRRLAEGQVLNIDPEFIITSDSRIEAKQLTLFVPHKRRAQICQGT